MKFKNDIEAQAGFKDAGGDLGVAGQLLSSTGAETNWVDASTVIGGPYLPLTAGGSYPLTGDLNLTYAYPRINLTDTNNDSDYSIINNDGTFSIYDVTNNSQRLTISAAGNATFAGAVNADLGIVASGAMSTFETTLTNNDDWQNSPISINERGNVGSAQTADKYAPNLNFHWGGIVSNSLWLSSNGHLNYGSYSSTGIPASDGRINAATFYGDHLGTINTATTGVTQTAGNNSTLIATTAYADAAAGAVPIGNYLPLVGGTMTGANAISLPDNFKLKIGTGSDLQIYHDGSNSYINESGIGRLILSGGSDIQLQSPTGEFMADFNSNGSVDLYYDNSKKFETTSTGATVTGIVEATGGNSTEWNTAYDNRIITLTTNGTSGAATLISNVLNIPNYADGQGVTSIITTNGITGGPISSIGTIQVDSTVLRTSSDQSASGIKTFTTRVKGNVGTPLDTFMMPQNPEGKHVSAPWFFNDIAYARLKGATVSVVVNGGSAPSTADIDAMLDASTGFWNMPTAGVTSVVITMSSLPKNMTYGSYMGLTFGNTNWRARNITLESYYNGQWNTLETYTNQTEEFVIKSYNSSSNAQTQLRYTLSNFNTTSMRIVSLFAYNYNATGMPSLYATLDGFSMYGQVDMNQNKIIDLPTPTASTDAANRAYVDDKTWDWNDITTGTPPTFNQNTTGNAATATTFSTGRTNYKGVTDGAVAGQLMWKNYGNNHTIFDASNSTSPSGTSVNNTNPTVPWTGTYPTLMGWNGSETYGVRVDSARYADNATTASNYLPLAGGTMTGKLLSPRTSLNRVNNIGSGYNYYSETINSWQTYMSAAGQTGAGYNGNLTAPTGTYVTSWAIRSVVEPVSGYGWTWEELAAEATGGQSVIAELSSSSGNFKTIGNMYASGGNSTEWNTAYDNSIVSATVTGTTTKTLTLNQQDGGTVTANWSDETGSGITGSGTTNYIPKFTGTTSLGNSLVYDNGTNVGIGTTNPATKLTLEGAKNTSIITLRSTTNDASWADGDRIGGIDFYSNDTSAAGVGVKGSINYETYSGTGGTTRMTFKVAGISAGQNNLEAMRIDAGGNVGINTTAPTEKLAVTGNIETTETADGVKIGFNVGDSFTLNGANTAHYGLSCGSSTSVPLVLSGYHGVAIATNGIERVRILHSNGNVGINETNPAEKLEVVGNIKANNYINQRVAWNSTFSHTTGTNVYMYIPVAYITEQSNDSYYLNWIAAYGGRVRKVVLRGVGTGPTQTVTTNRFRVMVNGSTVYTTGILTVTGTSPNKLTSYEFGDSDAVFSATDRVQVLFYANGLWYNAAVGIIIEYTE